MADDPFKYFRVEASELLDELARGALDLERPELAPSVMPRMLRLAHTMKGAARVVKQREIADLAHAVEDALGPFRGSESAVPRASIDVVLQLVDSMRTRAGALASPAIGAITPLPRPAAAPATAVPVSAAPAPVAEEPLRTLRADVEEIDGLLESVAEARGRLGGVRKGLGTLARANRLAELLVDQLAVPHSGTRASGKTLSIAQELKGLLASFEQSLARGVVQVDRELRQVRQIGERLRLLPAAAMLDVLERAVRDTAQLVGRRVRFEARGRDVRLDADVLATVQGALVQAARNAVAHGLEPEPERRATSKVPEGTVTIEVERRRGRAVFRCSDDGRGVDVNAVRAAARARGIDVGDAERLDDGALARLLLTGGISTSPTVTAVAGRGIGLDVVREAASRLRGEVRLRTTAGRGTTLELDVPISLSSLDALVVEIADWTAAIPLEAVRRTLRLGPADIARTVDGQAISFEGKVIPFAPLARPMRLAPMSPNGARGCSAVVIESGGTYVAVGADRLVGAETVIVRPVPAEAPCDPVVWGASIDEEGNPRVVLSAEALVALVARLEAPAREASEGPRPVLVIDDSLTTRMLEQSILELAGYEVDLATSGEEGLVKARRRSYALFLVDVEMPGMDGFTFVAQTRADPVLQKVPAMLVTSRDAPEDRQRGVDVGASAYIVKSEFDQNALLDRIRRLVA